MTVFQDDITCNSVCITLEYLKERVSSTGEYYNIMSRVDVMCFDGLYVVELSHKLERSWKGWDHVKRM